MGDHNQVMFLQKLVPQVNGPILEIGSKDYGNTASFRDFYKDAPYVGVDLEEGKGVDEVIDLVEGTGSLPHDHFDLIVCCSVLEHVTKPWVMAENMTRLCAKGGRLYISVPWVWRYHPYPDDYFRFSYRGVQLLFPDFEWGDGWYSTNVIGEFIKIVPGANGPDNQMAHMVPNGKGASRKYLPYMNVNMVGVRR